MKKAAEWFYRTVFRDEAIQPKPKKSGPQLPSVLRAARSLENGLPGMSQSREFTFLKQAKLLANYEDTYEFHGTVQQYYPTYQSLSDSELRGYFTWRTNVRQGDIQKTSLSFAFLYIYELLNQIGAEDAMDGYRKLTHFRDAYAPLDDKILPYLARWLPDYVVYYNLDANLLADHPQAAFDRSLTILEHISTQEDSKVLYAVNCLAPNVLNRSKFRNEYSEDFDAVLLPVLRRVAAHYDTKCKRSFVQQFFGTPSEYQVHLFDSAVFCNPLKRRNYSYILDERCIYRCRSGLWTVSKINCTQSGSYLKNLLKTVDSMMREAFQYRYPTKRGMDTKWILKVIQEEIDTLLAQKQAAEDTKITIDFSQLARIRQDAAVTQEKLIVDEETEEQIHKEPPPKEVPKQETLPQAAVSPPPDSPLSPPEYRLLQCLLYGGDRNWVSAEGHMLSVLVDSINEKLYDQFMDSVLDDTPELIPDYIDDLKEMVKP